MDILTIIILILCILYVGYIVFEKLFFNKIRKSFKYVIHVNGIRGKSTTTRLIDAGMRGCGFRVFSKTTGTVPTLINTNNEIVEIKRLGPANIREQLKTMYKAYKEKAEVLVIECMAINPELQYICEHRMLYSDVTLITNVRMDHIGDMGENLTELAVSLSNTIPDKGYLLINDDRFINIYKEVAQKRNTEIVIVDKYNGNEDMGTFKDNIAIAIGVSKIFNLSQEDFFNGMKSYHHDQGAYKMIMLGNTLFMNAFSANDPESIVIVYNKITENINSKDITILLNTRDDRATRTLQHIEMISKMTYKKVIIVGANGLYIRKKLREQKNLLIEEFKSIEELKKEKYIFATGNIGGMGMKILKYFEQNGENYVS